MGKVLARVKFGQGLILQGLSACKEAVTGRPRHSETPPARGPPPIPGPPFLAVTAVHNNIHWLTEFCVEVDCAPSQQSRLLSGWFDLAPLTTFAKQFALPPSPLLSFTPPGSVSRFSVLFTGQPLIFLWTLFLSGRGPSQRLLNIVQRPSSYRCCRAALYLVPALVANACLSDKEEAFAFCSGLAQKKCHPSQNRNKNKQCPSSV